MTKNDVNVLLPAQQASSTPSQGLLFGPSPRQQAAENKDVKQEEEPIGKQDSTTNTLTSANTQSKGSYTDALTNSTQETPCEKGVSTSRQQGHSKKPEETNMAVGKQQVKQEENKKAAKEASGAAHSPGAANSEVDFGRQSLSSSATSSTTSSSSQNPAPKKEAKAVAKPLAKRGQAKEEIEEQGYKLPKKNADQDTPLDQRGIVVLQQNPRWYQEGHQVRRKKEEQVPSAGVAAVAVDWYNTIYIKDHVPQSNLDSLWKLHHEGYQVHLLSFCGHERSLEVAEKAAALGFPFESITFTKDKKGDTGKGKWLVDNKIYTIFDDSQEVVDDCYWRGIWVYHISRRPNWHQYRTLGDAVDTFLKQCPLRWRDLSLVKRDGSVPFFF